MKKYLLMIVLFVVASQLVLSQSKNELVNEEGVIAKDVHGVRLDGSLVIDRFDKIRGITYPEKSFVQMPLRKTAWNFTVGSVKTWWSQNTNTNEWYQVSSTCKAVGANCYIFVEDAMWDSRVDQNAVNKFVEAFDIKTPANSNKGIFQTNVETFGETPNIDNDSKIIILIQDIKDGYEKSGDTYTAGYFHANNQTTNNYSNIAEIFYIDCNPVNLKNATDLNGALSTLAHEFQHMIHYKAHGGVRIKFFNEGWSLIAEVVNGFELREQSRFANEPNVYLLDWRSYDDKLVLSDYSRASRFALYLYEQFGNAILKNYLQSLTPGITGMEYAFTQSGSSISFEETLKNWFVANLINDKSIDPKYGYNYPNLLSVNPKVFFNPNQTSISNLYKMGAQYFSFKNSKNLKATIDFYGKSNKLAVIKYKTSSKELEFIPDPQNVSIPSLGIDYSYATLIVYNTSYNNDPGVTAYLYSFTSSGQMIQNNVELKYDTPPGYNVSTVNTGDTVAVWFEGLEGSTLDSLKIALRTLTEIKGAVYKYTGNLRPSPLGQALIPTLSATGHTYYSGSASPYADPWPNWVKVDLTNYKASTSVPFVAAFFIDGSYSSGNANGPNRIIHSIKKGDSQDHSYFYLGSTSGTTPNWYYRTSTINNEKYVLALMVRAYVSFPNSSTGVKESVELLPAEISLEQNYPNPFNPSTIISYTLPKQDHVQIKIFDVLGSEVLNLIDEQKPAGKYSILWNGVDNNGKQVTSGIYFYTIRTKEFKKTKKMVLIK